MITLTTIGSAGVELDVTPTALRDDDGVTLWIRACPGTPLARETAYALTRAEARQLAGLLMFAFRRDDGGDTA